MSFRNLALLLAVICALPAAAQTTRKARATTAPRLDPQKKFVLDVVKNAVALPQSDSQDRLRVLSAAVDVVSPIAPAYAKSLTTEGIRLESQLIGSGQTPSVSILSTGQVDC